MSVSRVFALLAAKRDDAGSASATYHFAVYLPQNRDSFFAKVVAGARKTAAANGIAVSFHSIELDDPDFRVSPLIGADGIIVCPYRDEDQIKAQLEVLRERKIPVIIINHNIPNDAPWPFVGTNNFDLGKKAASAILASEPDRVSLAVVYSEKTPAMYAERELVEMGLASVLGETLDLPVTRLKTDLNPQDAEKVLYQTFRDNPTIDTVVFTDVNDTLAGVQALIDMNLVGKVRIVGFGDDPAIVEYVKKGVVLASVAVSPERIGSQAIESLAELRRTGYTSASVDTGVTLIGPRPGALRPGKAAP